MRSWTSFPYGWADTVTTTDLQTAMNVIARQALEPVSDSTRCAQGLLGEALGGMVTADVDRKCEWPRRPALDKPGGTTRANDLVVGVVWPTLTPTNQEVAT